jgi:hypothetical protein
MCLSMHVFNIVSGRRDHAIDGGGVHHDCKQTPSTRKSMLPMRHCSLLFRFVN